MSDGTTIRYELPEAAFVRLEVCDMLGRVVTTLVQAPQSGGAHTLTFNAAGVAPGTYMLRLYAQTAHRVMVPQVCQLHIIR